MHGKVHMSKIREKIKEKREKKAKGTSITQQNIEESRDEILAKGKKFKYPFQYAKHRLIINAIAIGLIAIIVFVIVGWVQLYKAHNTSEVMYRFTRVIPLSVADADGVSVRFSDYLMLYRSSIRSIERQQGEFDDSEESQTQKKQFMRQALNDAEEYSVAMMKLKEIGKEVTDEEIDAVIKEHRTIDGELRSDEAFEGIVRDNFGLSIKEYRRLIMLSLSRKKVSIELDKDASKKAEKVEELITANNNDFKAVADVLKEDNTITFEEVTDVSYDNLDNGRAAEAVKLENVGDVSKRIYSKNGDGYYYIKLTAKSDTTVSYQSIWIQFKWFGNLMQKMRDDGKIVEKITIDIDTNADAETDEDTPEESAAEQEENKEE